MSGNNVQVRNDIQVHHCELCLKSFSSARHLNRHKKHFHERDCFFKCAYCNKGINFKDNLKRHLKNLHGITELIEGVNFTEEKLFIVPELETFPSSNANQNLPISVQVETDLFHQMVSVEEAQNSSSKVFSFNNDALPSKCEYVKSQLSTGPVVVSPQSEDIVTPNVKQRVVLKAVRPSAKEAQPSASAIRPSSRLDDLPEPLIKLLKDTKINQVIDSPLNREREVLEIIPVCPFGQGGLKKMLNDYFVMKKYIDHQFETKFPQLDKSSSLTDKINHLQTASEK